MGPLENYSRKTREANFYLILDYVQFINESEPLHKVTYPEIKGTQVYDDDRSSGFSIQWPRFESRLRRMEFEVDKVAAGKISSDYFGFSCNSFHGLLHIQHHPSSWAGTIGQIVADVPSEHSLAPPQETT
jgi:hypothetical protein